MPKRRKKDTKQFPFSRNDINVDVQSRATLADRIVQPGASIGSDDVIVGDIFTPVSNISVLSESAVLQPDGTYKMNVTIQWSDQAGAEEYEVWISEAT